MCNRLHFLIPMLLVLALCVASAQAATIIWVSFHGADDEPSANAKAAGFTVAPDKGYTDLLTANGYNVTRYITTGTPDPAVLNAADLVIISRSAASNHYQNASATAWNAISAPMIILNGYTLRYNRMGYTTGNTIPDITGNITLTVNDPTHTIFAGIPLTDGTMNNPYAGIVVYPAGTSAEGVPARGISINTDPVNNGTVLATISVAGNGPVGGMVIAEWQAGATLTHAGGAGTDTLAGHRLVFLTGSREASGIHSETAGMYDLYADGAQMFLNAVDYMLQFVATSASSPSPANWATDVPTDVALSWTPGSGAISHHIYFGTNQADVVSGTGGTDKGTQIETTYTPGVLAYGTTYYWRIDEFDGATTYTGNIWSLTTQGQGEGNILFEYFWGTNETLETLLNLPTFPDNPDRSELRTSFEGPINWRDTYGTLVRGYLYPPQTGNYTFWIASDDQSQLWLSTDEDPANAVQIASVPGWTPSRDFDNTGGGVGGPEQMSSEIALEAGSSYYIEALHSEGWGGDNLAVAWQGPSIPTRAIIAGTFLSPWIREIDLKAKNPSPPDGATLVPIDAVLTWTAGVYADKHDVYLGTDSLAVESANTYDTTGIYRGRQVTDSYIPPEGIQFGQTYYWRIDEVNPTHPDSPWLGDVWSFTTTGIVAPPISIPTETSVGTWDPFNRIYTLTQDVPQCIQIVEDNLILDGAGHKIVGPGSGNGVYLFGRTGVTIINLRVSQFQLGIQLWSCSNCTLTGNTCNSNSVAGIDTVSSAGNELINNTCNFNGEYGISINHSDDSTLTGNSNEWNTYFGIHLYYSNGNTLTGNTNNSNDRGITLYCSGSNTLTGNICQSNRWVGIHVYSSTGNTIESNTYNSNNTDGIFLENSNGNTLTGNTCNSNTRRGIYLNNSSNNTLTGNTFNSNPSGIELFDSVGNILTHNTNNLNGDGITLDHSGNNTLTDNTFSSSTANGIWMGNSSGNTLANNTISNSGYWGIQMTDSSNNQIYNNNFIGNTTQASVSGGSGNVFNLDSPTGGNFWSDWTTPDVDHDGFVDSPYVFTGGQDNLPWTLLNGWDLDLDGVPTLVENADPDGGDGNGDGIPDSQQGNVASLPNAADQAYVTIVSEVGTTLEDVSADDNPSPGDTPAGVKFPIGFFEFTVTGMEPGASTTVTLLLPEGHTVQTYYKYGRTSDNPTNHWYEFLWDGQTGAQINGNVITLHFVDGQRGDDDLTVNGQIVEPSAPAAIQVVGIDVKPGSYPNSFNNDAHGVIPVAILGSAGFDVSQVDVSTVRLEGLALRVKGNGAYQFSIKDVSGNFSNTMNGEPDGYPDLVCQFVDEDGVWSQGESAATVRGNLSSGAPFMGTDSVKITQ